MKNIAPSTVKIGFKKNNGTKLAGFTLVGVGL
jgi:hypothetical protein